MTVNGLEGVSNKVEQGYSHYIILPIKWFKFY